MQMGFPKMCDMLWAKVVGRENGLKKHLKTAFFLGEKNRHHLTLGGRGGQIIDTRSP